MLRAGLVNFSKGVLSNEVQGRIDVAAYNAGLKRGENIILLKQGAFQIRPGFLYISEASDPDERVLPFQFSDEQAYALAFGQETLQPMAGGGVVLEEELLITGATNANPVVLTVANHGYAAGDPVFVDEVLGGLGDYLNDRIWTVVASIDDDHFSINANGTGMPAFISAEGGVVRADPPDPPPPVPPTPPVYVPPDPPEVLGPGGSYGGGSSRGGGFVFPDLP